MVTLERLRESAISMQISQTGKDKRYNKNESSIAFIEGVMMYILPNVDIYEEAIEGKGYVYDSSIYIPPVDYD